METKWTNASRERGGCATWGFVPPRADHRIGVPLHRHGDVRPARREARRVSNSGLKRPVWGWKCAPIQNLDSFEPIQGLKLISEWRRSCRLSSWGHSACSTKSSSGATAFGLKRPIWGFKPIQGSKDRFQTENARVSIDLRRSKDG